MRRIDKPECARTIASALLRLASEHGDVIEGISHQEIGDQIGAYRETVTKVLDEFRAQGAVEMCRRRIEVRDRRLLERRPV